MAFPIAAAVALAAEFAPALIRWLADDEKAAQTAEKVGEVARTLTGSADPAEVAAILRENDNKAREFRLALVHHELELHRLDAEDRRDARARDVALRKDGGTNARANVLVGGAYFTMIACVGAIAASSLKNWALTGEVISMFSVLITGCIAVLKDCAGFEFGSSRSSRDKDVILATLAKNGHG